MNENQLKKVIADSLSEAFDDDEKVLDEAYVAEPKTYTQVSELVSQRTKDTHIHLYHDAIDSLNRISAELDVSNRGEANSKHSDLRSLKLDESMNANSVMLHEAYFANCFDPHSELYMDTISYMRLQRDFGTFEKWQSDFMACAQASNDGWVVCGYSTFLKRYINTIVSGNSHDVMIGIIPTIVVDMHEHAYFRDYLADKKSYIIAMMREFNWEVIEERFKKLDKVHEAMK